MGFERKMHPVLAEDLNILLSDLCTEWDFCAGVRAASGAASGLGTTN